MFVTKKHLTRRTALKGLGVALGRLATDPALRARLGAAARGFVRPRFGVEAYIESVSALYDRLLAAKGVA